MKSLISADLFHLFKDKLFYLLIAISILLPIVANCLFYFGYDIMVEQSPDAEALEKTLEYIKAYPLSLFAFEIANSAGLIAVIAIALYIGKEYMTGTIRNKVIAGHSRTVIYLASFVVSVTMALIIVTVFIATMLAVGIPMQGWGAKESIIVCLRQYAAGFLITLVSATVANMAAVLSRGIVASLLANLGIVFGLTGIVSIVTMLWSENTMPAFAAFFMKVVYMGQLASLMSDFSMGFFITTLVSSIVIAFIINIIGIGMFKKLDMN